MTAQNNALQIAALSLKPTIAWGSPGIGKSALIESMGAHLGIHVETVIASLRDPADFAGLPIVTKEGTVRLGTPAWAERLIQKNDPDKGVGSILFLDEISTAPPSVQAALLRVVLDRVVGDVSLPKNVAIIAAANPPEEAAGGWELSHPLANRLVHLKWGVDHGEWCRMLVEGWEAPAPVDLPADWKKTHGLETRALVASFLRSRPDYLLAVPDQEAQASGPWPSPRTWEMTADLMAAAEASSLAEAEKTEAINLLIAGAVGTGIGGEFLTYVDELDLPDPEQLLKDPDNFTLPERGDQQYAVLTSVAGAVVRKLTNERADAGWTIMALAAKAGAADVAAAAVRSLAQAHLDNPGIPFPAEHLVPFVSLLQNAGLLGKA